MLNKTQDTCANSAATFTGYENIRKKHGCRSTTQARAENCLQKSPTGHVAPAAAVGKLRLRTSCQCVSNITLQRAKNHVSVVKVTSEELKMETI